MVKGVTMPDKGSGEAAERASRNRWIRMIATGAVLAGITGFTFGYGESQLFEGAIPIWLASLIAAAWLAIMAYGAWYYETQVDEVERNANHHGYAIGGGLLLIVYPVWSLFWWAGLIAEPSHEILMGLFLGGAAVGYLWKKYA